MAGAARSVTADGAGPADLVRRRYPVWFPALGPRATVESISASGRRQSSIAVVRIDDGVNRRSVVVKTNLLSAGPDRPRLGLTTDFGLKHRYEGAALRLMANQFRADPEPGLGWVDVVEITDANLVLHHVESTSLARHLRMARRRPPAHVLIGRAGRWLRLFHELPLDGQFRSAREDATAVADTFRSYVEFLAPSLDRSLADRVRRFADRFVADLVEKPPSLGLGHGDFAPRNVLIEPEGRVCVIDPLGWQRCPIHEDLAYFAISLRRGALIPWLGPVSRRRAARLEQALLDGYGLVGDDLLTYQGFGVLVALDMLAADRVRPGRPTGARAALDRTLPSIETILDSWLTEAE